MPKPTLDYYNHNFSPMLTADYMVIFSGFDDLGPMVAEFSIPERNLNPVRVEIAGKSKIWPGRRISGSNEVSCNLLINRKLMTYQQLIAIQESFSASDTGNMVGKFFNVKVIQYDEVGNEAMVFTFKDCWLRTVGEYQLAAADENNLVTVPCVLAYSRMAYQWYAMAQTNENGDIFIPESNNIETVIQSRLDPAPIRVGNSDDNGIFKPLSYSQTLPGVDPVSAMSQLKQSLIAALKIDTDTLQTMSSVIGLVRNGLSGRQSASSIIRESGLETAVSSLSKIRTIF